MLSEIIARLNEKYGTEFDESEKLALSRFAMIYRRTMILGLKQGQIRMKSLNMPLNQPLRAMLLVYSTKTEVSLAEFLKMRTFVLA